MVMKMDYLKYYAGPVLICLTIAGLLAGGPWMWVGIASFPVMLILDSVLPEDMAPRNMPNDSLAVIPVYLSVGLGFVLMGSLAWVAGQGTESAFNMAGGMLSTLWIVMLPVMPAIHELMHQRSLLGRYMGRIGGALFMDPMRDVCHLAIHHIYVGQKEDCDTPERGINIYRFAARGTVDNYKLAFRHEKMLQDRKGGSIWGINSRVVEALLMVGVMLAGAAWIGGLTGMVVVAITALGTKFVLEQFNYLQHYGLIRVNADPNVARRHIWNHLKPVSRLMTFEITNHYEHHLDGYLPYQKLTPDPKGPQMPSAFLCFALALIPPLWFKYIAKPRLEDWDKRFATAEEREIARAENKRAGWPDWFAGKGGDAGMPSFQGAAD